MFLSFENFLELFEAGVPIFSDPYLSAVHCDDATKWNVVENIQEAFERFKHNRMTGDEFRRLFMRLSQWFDTNGGPNSKSFLSNILEEKHGGQNWIILSDFDIDVTLQMYPDFQELPDGQVLADENVRQEQDPEPQAHATLIRTSPPPSNKGRASVLSTVANTGENIDNNIDDPKLLRTPDGDRKRSATATGYRSAIKTAGGLEVTSDNHDVTKALFSAGSTHEENMAEQATQQAVQSRMTAEADSKTAEAESKAAEAESQKTTGMVDKGIFEDRNGNVFCKDGNGGWKLLHAAPVAAAAVGGSSLAAAFDEADDSQDRPAKRPRDDIDNNNSDNGGGGDVNNSEYQFPGKTINQVTFPRITTVRKLFKKTTCGGELKAGHKYELSDGTQCKLLTCTCKGKGHARIKQTGDGDGYVVEIHSTTNKHINKEPFEFK